MTDDKEIVMEFVDVRSGKITNVKTMEERQLTDEELKEITKTI